MISLEISPSALSTQGVWDQQIQTIIYRMDKQQGPIV